MHLTHIRLKAYIECKLNVTKNLKFAKCFVETKLLSIYTATVHASEKYNKLNSITGITCSNTGYQVCLLNLRKYMLKKHRSSLFTLPKIDPVSLKYNKANKTLLQKIMKYCGCFV